MIRQSKEANPDFAKTSYSASWREPGSPEKQCGVNAGEYGVDFWEKWGPSPNEEWGKGYTWAQWFAEGTAGAGGPTDLLARIDAVGRRLGHKPPASTAPLSRREMLGPEDKQRHDEHRRYVRELQRQALHSTPETLKVSRGDLARMRKQVLRHADCLWRLLRPGVKVKGTPELVDHEGTRTIRRTEYVTAMSAPAYTMVQTEDLFKSEDGEQIWFSLRVQCALDRNAQFGIWFHEGVCQMKVILADEAAVDAYTAALKKTDPTLFNDPDLCGAVRAFVEHGSSRTMFNHSFGRTGPTRLVEQAGSQLWPLNPTSQVNRKSVARFDGLPTIRPWSNRVKQILGFAFDPDDALELRARESGLHWVVPIGTTTYDCWIGVRQLPHTPLDRCPVLLCHGGNATTIATELRDSLAILVWWLGPRTDAAATMALKQQWHQVEDDLQACADGIGGAAALQRLRTWMEDDLDPDLSQAANSAPYLGACAQMIAMLDPLQRGFREQVVAVAAGDPVIYDTVPRVWHEALAATHYTALLSDPERAWRVACAMPSLDTGGRMGVGHFVNTKFDWSRQTPWLAAKVSLRVERAGPVAHALAALVESEAQATQYDGITHVKAAARASVDGDHETAWILLGAAGYWSATARGKADPVIFEAAQVVAKQAGYWPLDNLRG